MSEQPKNFLWKLGYIRDVVKAFGNGSTHISAKSRAEWAETALGYVAELEAQFTDGARLSQGEP